ncbi:HAD family phosphatase [Allokutzneria sp. NRRL B-24872]|uniref:HAD family hydrolase n=1 Tax=Allokutzneria sp. NRRL B-24872 TaxID=1137961 RepID=UPI001177F8CA|nr:HAD-IB family phosphatase [Allokutzneria sp. NRRL B-24872]
MGEVWDERAGSRPIAVLDMDGTLYDGCIGVAFIAHLVRVGLAAREAVEAARRAFDAYERGSLSTAEAADLVYDHYALALTGHRVEDVRYAAEECWTVVCEHLFPFSRNVVDRLAERGVLTVLLSGSPDEIVQVAARELGIDQARGALSEVISGRYTGKVLTRPGEPGGKSSLLDEIRPERSRVFFAMGNSVRDEVVMRAEITIAFEPDAGLAALARARGWAVADRATIEATLAELVPGYSETARTPG